MPPSSPRTGPLVVLGIDAAWSLTAPSGLAVIRREDDIWRAVACAPSEPALLELAEGRAVDWSARPSAGSLEQGPLAPGPLAAACAALAGAPPGVVAVDMPLARSPVRARRAADDETSRRFGAAGASTHSPLPERPGPLADRLRAAWAELDVPLRTTRDAPGAVPALLEVHPHASLLDLCRSPRRLPYKASRALRYWPGTTVAERVERLLAVWRRIASALEVELGPGAPPLPPAGEVTSLAALKRFEDALDALVCAWTGARYADGRAEALGDDDAAIWVPAEASVPL